MKKSLFHAVAYLLIFSICFSSPAEAGWLGDAWNWTKEASSSAWQATKDASSAAWKGTKKAASASWNWTKEASSSAWQATKDASSAAWKGTKKAASASWNWTKEAVPSLLQYGIMAAAGAKIIWELYKKAAPPPAKSISEVIIKVIIKIWENIPIIIEICKVILKYSKRIWKYRKIILKVIFMGRVPIPGI